MALETDSAWVVILAVSFVTLVAVGILRRVIGRPGGVASGVLLALPLVLPLVAAVVYQQAVLPEIAVLQPAGEALSPRSENLLHLLLVANDHGKGFTPYALAGSAGPWVVMFGVLFSSFMLLRRVAGQIVLRRLVNRSVAPEDGLGVDLQALVRRLSARAGLRFEPEVLLLPPGSLGAFATGGRPPKVLLCRELVETLDPNELEAIVAHEVGHLRSKDVQLVATAGFLRDVVAWNPFAHIAYRKLARNREFEADRSAAELTGDPLSVASGLVKMCELMRGGHRRKAALAFLRPGARVRGRVSALLALSDGGGAALRSQGVTPYAVAALMAAVLGLQVGAQLTKGEGALAIMFGSPTADVERWTGVGALDTKRGQATKQGKIVSGNGRERVHSQPQALKPFSDPVSLRRSQLAQWKRQMRLAARNRGLDPLLFSRSGDDYEAVPLIPEAAGGVGLYRIRQLQ